MARLANSISKNGVTIDDYYALTIRKIWRGLKSESAAFWWLCIYLFFEYVRPASIYPVLQIIPWTQISLLATCFFIFSDKSIRFVKSKTNFPILLLLFIVLLSSFFAFYPSTSWSKIDVPIVWVVVYFLIINIINTEKRFFIFILLFLLVNFKMSQHGFFTFATRGFSFAGWGVAGSPGWFSNAADFGVAMLIFCPLSVSFVIALRKHWGRFKRLFFYFLPVTGLVSIVATSNRGAQLGMIAVGAWVLVRNLKGLRVVIGLLVVAAAMYAIVPDRMFERFETAGEDTTSQDRLRHWEFGIDVTRDYPLLGIGFENWIVYCNVKNPNGLGSSDSCLAPHNTYIEAAAQIGVSGLLLYLLLIIQVFRLNSKTRDYARKKENDFLFYTAHGLDVGLIGYLVATIFVSELFWPFFWFQLAITVSLHAISIKGKAKTELITNSTVNL